MRRLMQLADNEALLPVERNDQSTHASFLCWPRKVPTAAPRFGSVCAEENQDPKQKKQVHASRPWQPGAFWPVHPVLGRNYGNEQK